MTQGEAQMALLACAAVWAWGLVMAHINAIRPHRLWWLVPVVLAAPAVVDVYLTAVLG